MRGRNTLMLTVGLTTAALLGGACDSGGNSAPTLPTVVKFSNDVESQPQLSPQDVSFLGVGRFFKNADTRFCTQLYGVDNGATVTPGKNVIVRIGGLANKGFKDADITFSLDSADALTATDIPTAEELAATSGLDSTERFDLSEVQDNIFGTLGTTVLKWHEGISNFEDAIMISWQRNPSPTGNVPNERAIFVREVACLID